MTERPGSEEGPERRRGLSFFSGTFGAALEWYDFTLYVYLATVISGLFFPSENAVDSLLATFGVFAAGYIMRPLGAAVIGNYGDTHGRKAALLLSIGVMAVGMVLIGVLPTEGTIGFLAPLALVLIRLAQGFSLGGEFGGAITLLAESAPARKRGWVVNFAQVSASLGTMASAGIVVLLHAQLSDAQMADFGWRIPFFLGGLIGAIAMFALFRTPESEVFEPGDEKEEEVPIRVVFTKERLQLIVNSLLNGYQSLSYYVVVTFVPTYLITFEGAKPEEGTLAGLVAAIVFGVASPPSGRLSDRYGRKPVMYGAALLMAVCAVPLFLVLAEAQTAAVIPAQATLMLLVTLFSGAMLVTATELFGPKTRYTGVAVGFNLGAAVFGGTAPLIATALISITDFNQAPAVLLAVASILVLYVVFRTPETAPIKLDQEDAR